MIDEATLEELLDENYAMRWGLAGLAVLFLAALGWVSAILLNPKPDLPPLAVTLPKIPAPELPQLLGAEVGDPPCPVTAPKDSAGESGDPSLAPSGPEPPPSRTAQETTELPPPDPPAVQPPPPTSQLVQPLQTPQSNPPPKRYSFQSYGYYAPYGVPTPFYYGAPSAPSPPVILRRFPTPLRFSRGR